MGNSNKSFNDIKSCINNSYKIIHNMENEKVNHLFKTFQFKLNKNRKK